MNGDTHATNKENIVSNVEISSNSLETTPTGLNTCKMNTKISQDVKKETRKNLAESIRTRKSLSNSQVLTQIYRSDTRNLINIEKLERKSKKSRGQISRCGSKNLLDKSSRNSSILLSGSRNTGPRMKQSNSRAYLSNLENQILSISPNIQARNH